MHKKTEPKLRSQTSQLPLLPTCLTAASCLWERCLLCHRGRASDDVGGSSNYQERYAATIAFERLCAASSLASASHRAFGHPALTRNEPSSTRRVARAEVAVRSA